MIPADDSLKLRSLARAVQGGTISPLALAERAYSMGSLACHQAMAAEDPSVETFNLAELEKRAIRQALDATEGNILAAAKLLGVGKTTVYRKAKEYQLVTGRVLCANCHRPVEGRPLCLAPSAA